jgi:pimeloyl-ACP methyl ester carboxylesterase
MNISHESIVVSGSNQLPIGVDITYENNNQPKPLVFFVHGFKGFKDWGHFNLLAKYFAQNGFVFVKFNFSHNGTTIENPLAFDNLEAFGNNNFIFELDDMKTVMDFVLEESEIKNEIESSKIYMIGHSRGGGMAVIKASEDLRITKLVTWAAVSDVVSRNHPRTIDTWKTEGVVYTKNARTNQNMPLYAQLYESTQANKQRLDIGKAAQRLRIPFLIIHGTNDEAVRIDDAKHLHNRCKTSQLYILEHAGHTFGVSHPWEHNFFPPDAEKVIARTIDFFKS